MHKRSRNYMTQIFQLTREDLHEFGRGLLKDFQAETSQDFVRMVEEVIERKEKASRIEYGPVPAALDTLQVTKPTLYRLIGEGRVEVQKVGRRTMVNMTKLRDDLAAGRLAKYGRAK